MTLETARTDSWNRVSTQYDRADFWHPNGHQGRDYAVSETRVYSADSGVVALKRDNGKAGNELIIRGSSPDSYYLHLNSFVVNLGDSVVPGQLIAYSGNTGHSTGPHLHFEQHTPGPISGAIPDRFTSIAPCTI